jgi:hypothetical protein
MFTLKTSFEPLLLKGVGGIKSLSRGVNSKEEKSKDFCPSYVQEFVLWIQGTPTEGNRQRIVRGRILKLE